MKEKGSIEMMREILFRGKRKDNGEWVEGDLRQDKDTEQVYISGWNYYANCTGLERDPFEHEVIPETVGQYTGLNDNNGRKMFEGDVVKCFDERIDVKFCVAVKFGNPNEEFNWGYQLNFISGDRPNLDILCCVEMEETEAYIEVVGNIHDTPELLKREGE